MQDKTQRHKLKDKKQFGKKKIKDKYENAKQMMSAQCLVKSSGEHIIQTLKVPYREVEVISKDGSIDG